LRISSPFHKLVEGKWASIMTSSRGRCLTLIGGKRVFQRANALAPATKRAIVRSPTYDPAAHEVVLGWV
jgi:hypothetical protein